MTDHDPRIKNQILDCCDLGRIDYQTGLELQDRLHGRRLAEEIGDTALFLEHEHVITLGKRGEAADILVSGNELEQQGVAVHQSNRGGQVTYHGPGQLVVYLIFNLYEAQRELRRFVENLEQSVIGLLEEDFGLKAGVDPHHPGVWVDDKKVAALGISVRQRVTTHGLALNINTDLAKFRNIIPCGISDRGVTSIAELLGHVIDFGTVRQGLATRIARQYGFAELRWVDKTAL
jgi:lipoyl(octanoyl) transferase